MGLIRKTVEPWAHRLRLSAFEISASTSFHSLLVVEWELLLVSIKSGKSAQPTDSIEIHCEGRLGIRYTISRLLAVEC